MFIAVTAAFHLHFMLTVGDWDFWIDWKDRQYRVTATPVVLIMFPAALQYVFWERFRLPIGATLAMLALTFGVWVSRTMGFHLWSYFPFSFGDYIGYAFTRTSTPAYLRFIERGTLRTFGGHSAGVSAFFSGFICIFMYLLWWYIGKALSAVITIPNRFKGAMGLPNVASDTP